MTGIFTEKDREIIIGQREKHLDARQLQDIPIFFVVGRPRSGTTLLRTLFDAHPNVIVPPECQFIVNLYPKYSKIRSWNDRLLEDFYSDLIQQWRFDVWPLDRERLHRSLMACAGNNTYGTLCKVVYHEYRSIFRHGVLLAIGDKNPGYTIYTKRLLKIFPEAKFIHIVRDYRDNFVSIRNVDFELPFISVTVSKWKYFVKRFRKAASKHPCAYIEVRYEDLVGEPEKTFRKLCDFVGVPYSDKPFDFYKKSEEVLKIYPTDLILKYHSSLLKEINTSRTGLWKDALAESELRVADACAGKYGSMTGHPRIYNKPGISAHFRSFPGRAFAAGLYLATRIVDHLPNKVRMSILSKAPLAMGRLYLSIFNREKLRELDERMKEGSGKQAYEPYSGLRPGGNH